MDESQEQNESVRAHVSLARTCTRLEANKCTSIKIVTIYTHAPPNQTKPNHTTEKNASSLNMYINTHTHYTHTCVCVICTFGKEGQEKHNGPRGATYRHDSRIRGGKIQKAESTVSSPSLARLGLAQSLGTSTEDSDVTREAIATRHSARGSLREAGFRPQPRGGSAPTRTDAYK